MRYRLAVGHAHGVKPGNIVGAIANEAGVDSRRIGRVDIRDDYSLVDLPAGMPDDILAHLKKVWVVGQQLRISPERPGDPGTAHRAATPRKTGRLHTTGQKAPRKPGFKSGSRSGPGPGAGGKHRGKDKSVSPKARHRKPHDA